MARVGVGDLDITHRARRWGVGLLMLGIGAAVGYALPQNTASPRSAAGTVMSVSTGAGNSGIQFVFKPDGATKTVNYTFENPTPWQQQASGNWHLNGQPTCLVPGSSTPARITLGVVTISGVGSAPGGPVVVWVECYA